MTDTEIKKEPKIPREVEGRHVMWTFTTVEKAYNDGTTEKVGSYKINKDFLAKLPQSRMKFNENTKLSIMVYHFNQNVIGNTRIAVIAESFKNKRHEGITTIKEFKKLKQKISDLANRPKISLLIALKFKLMLEYYGFTDILVD